MWIFYGKGRRKRNFDFYMTSKVKKFEGASARLSASVSFLMLYLRIARKCNFREKMIDIFLSLHYYWLYDLESHKGVFMKQFFIGFFGSSGDGYVGYDNEPCNSLDMALVFSSEEEAFLALDELQAEWSSNLKVCEVEFD